ncbi:MAG TPA: hypothetical protein VFQ85_08390 [Mycobacteriales bacterium]|jgi:hypothetical protein|nr:hypothetical protein [Mycobacteriales bacterium]
MRARILALAVAAALAAPAPATATVTAADGRALPVGSVVAYGARHGDTCTFDAPSVALAGDEVALGLRADDGCRLVVWTVSPAVADSLVQVGRPKTDADGATAPNAADLTSSGSGPTVSGPEAAAVGIVTAAASQDERQVLLRQSVYKPGGVRVYEDEAEAVYLVDRRTGALSGLQPTGGYCAGDLLSDFVYSPLTEVVDCYYKRRYGGPDRIGFLSGGYYREVVAGIQTDGRTLTETFNRYRGKPATWTYDAGGALPVGWYTYFYARDV